MDSNHWYTKRVEKIRKAPAFVLMLSVESREQSQSVVLKSSQKQSSPSSK